MKNLILIVSMVLAGVVSAAERKEKVISVNNTQIEIALNAATVLCSRADYGASFLKILIPELAELTVFNHRNTGVAAPCVAAGMCKGVFGNDEGFDPSDILNDVETEKVNVEVKLTRLTFLDKEKKKCHVNLQEDVLINVRGIDFKHQRSQSLGERVLEDCL